jgi:predicted TIM-barrel fold metal-dependent hydrolase
MEISAKIENPARHQSSRTGSSGAGLGETGLNQVCAENKSKSRNGNSSSLVATARQPVRGTRAVSAAILVTLLALSAFAGESHAREVYFIDVHSQVDRQVDSQTVVALLNQGGVRETILSSTGNASQEKVLDLARRNPAQIIAAVRTKGYMTTTPPDRYRQTVDAQVRSRAYGAMAEVLVYHAAKSAEGGRVNFPEVSVEPDDPRVLFALDLAIRNRWPFIIHIEFAALPAAQRTVFMTKFEALLAKYPDEPFALIHMGQLDASEVGRLIAAHPNVCFIASTSNPITANRGNQPWTNMFAGRRLAAEWKALLVGHPDRFLLAFDNVVAPSWGQQYLGQIALWRGALADLPDDVADSFAHGNAERLWHLPRRTAP